MSDAYRKKVEREVAEAARSAARAIETARDERRPVAERIRALVAAAPVRDPRDLAFVRRVAADRAEAAAVRAQAIGLLAGAPSDLETLQMLIARLGDDGEAVAVRVAAATALQVATFHAEGLADQRADYIAAYRRAGDADEPQLRERALGVLAREKDAPTMRKLERGLRDPGNAVVDPEKALQYLSYDTKRDVRDLMVEIVEQPPSEGARHQALRNLAGDASCKPLFTRLARDKGEDREARLIAMSALQAIDPAGMEKVATSMVEDDDEDDDIRGACLTAMSTIEPTKQRPALHDAATRLAKKGRTPAARNAAKLYLGTREG